MNRRLLALLGLGIAVAANGLCLIGRDYEALLWFRLVAGTGSGI